MKYAILFVAMMVSLISFTGFAQESETDSLSDANLQAIIDSLTANLQYQTGTVELGEGVATLHVPDGFKYLDSEQASYVLVDLWGNPPMETLGMLFPAEYNPLDNTAWAVNIEYSEEGYVDDEDAADIDYDELLTEMQEDALNSNEERLKQGYQTIKLVGWASQPHYDAQHQKLHWAKELKFSDAESNTLNYNIRVLGRKGVLVLNAIGSMNQYDEIQPKLAPVMAGIDFNDGYRYSDFNPDLDDVATYGIGGLIAGKVLAKTGLIAVLLKMWKVLLIGAAAGITAIRRFFGGKSTKEDTTA